MKKRIGDILIEMGFIDNDQLNMALAETKKTGAMLGDTLLRLDWASEEQLQMAIAVQSGAEILDLETVKVDLGLIAKIPKEFVAKHMMFPFSIKENIIKSATSNPFDVIARDQLARMTGNQVETYIAPKEWILKNIELYYETALTIDQNIEVITSASVTERDLDEDKIIKLADLIIEKGRVLGASDIHIEPDSNLVRIYYRIDGVLHQNYIFPKAFHQTLVTRLKIMGGMDIANPNIPHDGRIRHKGSFGVLDLRVSTFPTHLGETVVLRLLIYSKMAGDLNTLGFEKDDLAKFQDIIKQPYGLILTTGPTGSGKTTSLYTALMNINSPSINVMTVEDPIEYIIPTIRQTAVNPKAGLTFGNALRAAMRQDPDVLLVGEIRDKETADLAMRASITGHLVFSTLHTNNAASSINRLLDLGVNKNILASALTMVVAQRLLRKICPHCFRMAEPTPEEKDLFVQNDLEPPSEIPKAVGCNSCFNSGYSGRAGIYEVVQIDRKIQELIFSEALNSQIEDAALKAGASLMLKQGLRKVAAHATSLEEIFRVIANA
jgi:type IV pilus assembly protein PilB